MSDTSSIICLDDVVTSNVTQTKGPKKKEPLYAVISYRPAKDNIKVNGYEPAMSLLPSPEAASNLEDCDVKMEDEVQKDNIEDLTTPPSLLKPIFALEEGKSNEETKNEWMFPCKYCEMIFVKRKDLSKHYLEHGKERREQNKHDSIFECHICKKVFNHKTDLNWHMDECKGRFLAENEEVGRRVTRSSLAKTIPIPVTTPKTLKKPAKNYRTLTKKDILKISNNHSKVPKNHIQENKVEKWLQSIS